MHISGSEINTADFVLCSIPTLLKYLSMSYKICVFGESVYELNALIFAFKTGIAKCKVKFMPVI